MLGPLRKAMDVMGFSDFEEEDDEISPSKVVPLRQSSPHRTDY
ncbi:hypothetical protein DSOL_5154 [Desulfosporosinus metallidurans]|uniref:Uncharacterized protein n=1 Tax=Desulfosporosinus metallidurans TaxID=1888891 RepID=A0A1Q8QFC0_9FIRM|nr:hypothetical protein DSOL_5154 [Desulfosporosinus metallidurans]